MEPSELQDIATAAANKAIADTKQAQEAVEQSRLAQAALTAEATHERSVEALSEALRRVFGENETSGRFIDVSRIPLICQSIVSMKESLESIDRKVVTQDQFWPVKTITYGLVGSVMLAIIGALVASLLK